MVFTAAKKVELPNFGEKLKKMRENLGMGLEKAAQLLNTQVKYLEKLEQGEMETLPAEVYMKGLLRRYAKILEVDEAALLVEYGKELNIARYLSKAAVHRSLPSLRSPRLIITPKTMSLIFGGLLFFFVIGYLVYQLNFLISPPKLILEQPAGDLATNEKTLEIIGQTDSGSRLTINGQEVYIDKDGRFRQMVNLNEGLNSLKIEVANRFNKSQSILRQIMVR